MQCSVVHVLTYYVQNPISIDCSRAKLRRIAERRFYNSHNINNNNNNSFYYNNNIKKVTMAGYSRYVYTATLQCRTIIYCRFRVVILLPTTTPITEVLVNNLFYFYGFRVDIGIWYIYLYIIYTCETNTPHKSAVNTKTRPLKLLKSKKL